MELAEHDSTETPNGEAAVRGAADISGGTHMTLERDVTDDASVDGDGKTEVPGIGEIPVEPGDVTNPVGALPRIWTWLVAKGGNRYVKTVAAIGLGAAMMWYGRNYYDDHWGTSREKIEDEVEDKANGEVDRLHDEYRGRIEGIHDEFQTVADNAPADRLHHWPNGTWAIVCLPNGAELWLKLDVGSDRRVTDVRSPATEYCDQPGSTGSYE